MGQRSGARGAVRAVGRHYARRALKKGALFLLKGLVAVLGPAGALVLGVMILALLAVPLLQGLAAGGDRNLDGEVTAEDRLWQERYERASLSSAPDGPEASFRVPWGVLAAVDVVVGAERGAMECRAEDSAHALAPRFSYVQSEEVLTVYRDDGPEVSRSAVRLPVRAETYRGVWRIEWARERETGVLETGERYVREYDRISRAVPVTRDLSRLREYLEARLGREVTDPDLKLVLELAAAAEGRAFALAGEAGEVPAELVPVFQEAGAAHGVPWQVLCAIAWVESRFDPLAVGPPNYTGELAEGMMQFLPSTWRRFGVDADGDGVASPFSPVDAIWSAAAYLEACGAREDLPRALYAYNHADWYVQQVLEVAAAYGY
ncbi:MAG: lytic transglycosylase domain-containing protein [Bacillota bacterium]|nr:lytic transglycosylase domain-containing protein [Bacillota bacterium]